MVMVINQRIKRVFLENKAQYIGSILLIILSCFTFTLMTHFAANYNRLNSEFADRYTQEDATFTTDKPIEDLPELQSAANAVIEEGRTFDYNLPGEKKLRVFSQNKSINLPAVTGGKGLSKSGDILIHPLFAAANDFKLGDRIKLSDKTFTVVGLVALPNYIYPLQSETDMMPPPTFGIAVISKEDFSVLDKGSSFYAVKFNQPGPTPRAQSAKFRELLESQGIGVTQWTDIKDNKRVSFVNAEGEVLNLVSRGVPTAMMLLAVVMVANVIWRLINRESTVTGALYALGYRRKEIYRHYLIYPLLIGLIGGVVGTVTGILPVRSMVEFMFSYIHIPLTGIRISPVLISLSLILPVILLTASSYFVLRKELKHSPVELMRSKQEKNKVNFLERVMNLERFTFSTKFKIREQLRSLSRIGFLLVGIAVATMLVLWGFTLKSGMDTLLTTSLTGTYDYVYEYTFKGLPRSPLSAGAEPFSAALFEPQGDAETEFYVTGITPNTGTLTLKDASGARLNTNQVIITRPLANRLEVEPGDTVSLVRKSDWQEFSVKIDAVADTYAGKFVFMPLSDYNETFGMPEGSYNGAFSNAPLNIPEDVSYSVVTMEEKVAAFEGAIKPLKSMVALLSVVAFFIGMIVIYVVTSLIVEENKNTISLMKIFGYRRKEVNSLVLNSSTAVIVIGFIIGIPLTTSAVGVLAQSMEKSVGLALPPMQIDPLYLVTGFAVVLLSYELSKRLCRKRVNRVSMSEALKAGME